MAEASGKYKQGDSPALFEFAKRARDYIALLTQHINKENNVLFPMGERVLSAKKQEELVEAFERLERERIGEGTWKGDRLNFRENLGKAIEILKECGSDGWLGKYEKELALLS